MESSKPQYRELKNSDRKRMVGELLAAKLGGKFFYGLLTVKARKYEVSHSTASRLWVSAKVTRATGIVISPEIKSDKTMRGRKPKYPSPRRLLLSPTRTATNSNNNSNNDRNNEPNNERNNNQPATETATNSNHNNQPATTMTATNRNNNQPATTTATNSNNEQQQQQQQEQRQKQRTGLQQHSKSAR